MEIIRCDQQDYLIWKWRPEGYEANTTKKENSITYGSSLNVKDGELAVFVYKQSDGVQQDFIEGPYNDTIKTVNFPILSKLVGIAFGGASPFQAEVYYINLSGLIRLQFAIPYFDVFDSRVPDLPISVAVRGSFAFKITDYKNFIKLHRLSEFDLEKFKLEIKDTLSKYVKHVVINLTDEGCDGKVIPVVQLEKKIIQINEAIQSYVEPKLAEIFGVNLVTFDISNIEVDKECDGYQQLKQVTSDYSASMLKAQQEMNLFNMQETNRLKMEQLAEQQRMQLHNAEETLRMNREESQFAQHQQTEINTYNAKMNIESANLGAFGIRSQTEIGVAGAAAIGKSGESGGQNVNLSSQGGGFNPGAMVAGMAIGQTVGQGMASLIGNSINTVTQIPVQNFTKSNVYNVAVNGVSTGPFAFDALREMSRTGQFTKQSLVWCAGMQDWQSAESVSELAVLFSNTAAPPVPPPIP